jgi:hypothetical protein
MTLSSWSCVQGPRQPTALPQGLSPAPFVGPHGLIPGAQLLPGGPFWSEPPPSDMQQASAHQMALRLLGMPPEVFAAISAGILPGGAGTPSSSSPAGSTGLFGFNAQTPAAATAGVAGDKSTDKSGGEANKSTDSKSTGDQDEVADRLRLAKEDEAAAEEIRRQFEEKKRAAAAKRKASADARKAAKESKIAGEETADKENTTVGSKASKEKDSANDDFDAEVAKDFEFFRVNDLTFENAVGRRVLSRHGG